jgi:hypothetical protein
MKKIATIMLTGSFMFSSQFCLAQTKKTTVVKTKKVAASKPAPKPMNEDEMQKVWATYMTPTEVHKMLAQSDGDWTGDVTHWMTPKSEPMQSKCTATNKMIMGGRYQQSDFKGEFMGMPFEGMNLLAFDNAKKVFISNWVDNMGTGMMTMEGTWDEKTKTITFTGKMVDPMTGKDCDVKETFTIVDDNTQVMTMYAPNPDGKGMFKTMQIKFKRG